VTAHFLAAAALMADGQPGHTAGVSPPNEPFPSNFNIFYFFLI
jgi:hypothetical protein